MSEQAKVLPDPYRVRSGDTLSKIARLSGRRLSDLMRWNGIRNADRLEVGQVLYLSEASAFGISVLFLDALRHPIQNLPYRLQFDGKTVTGKTDASGLVPRQVTRGADSVVETWIEDVERRWRPIASVVSGIGHKLVTLVSGYVVVRGQTELLPAQAPAVPVDSAPEKSASPAAESPQSPRPEPVAGTAAKNNPAVKARKTKGPEGQSVVKIGVEMPKGLLELFAKYTGGDITPDDWKTVAESLGCEVAVLKAFAEVESGGRSSFWRLNSGGGANVPAVLYERHYFSRITAQRYDHQFPDISWSTGYREKSMLGQRNKYMPFGKVLDDDVYLDYASSYLRLIKAYGLDKSAALQSCSWGKFQIMGANYKLCKVDSVEALVGLMCASELKQMDLVAAFIRNKPRQWKDKNNEKLGKEISLWDAIKLKDWRLIAFNYNGPDFRRYGYDVKMKEAYEKYSMR